MARSEKALSSCPLNLATTLRSSVLLKQVPTMEQYSCVPSSQRLRGCLPGIPCGTVAAPSHGGERKGAGGPASTIQGRSGGIGTCADMLVIPRAERDARPQTHLARLVYDILHIVKYN